MLGTGPTSLKQGISIILEKVATEGLNSCVLG